MVAQSRPPRLVLTRPKAQAERFAQSLPEALLSRTRLTISPLLEIHVTGTPDLSQAEALILTSENALLALPKDLGLTAYCVGPRSAAAATAHGLRAEACGGNADQLVTKLATIRPKERLLHLHGAHVRGDVARRLREAGLNCKGVAIYDQVAVPLPGPLVEEIIAGAPALVPLFSPRTAKLFARACPTGPGVRALCLSDAVAAALPTGVYQEIRVANEPNAPSMVDGLLAM